MPTFRHLARAIFCLALSAASVALGANPPEVDRALAWLAQQPHADGTVAGEAASIATVFQARAETLIALGQLATAPTFLGDSVAAETEDSTEYVARKIIALAPLGRDVSASLANLATLQNSDGGFGGAAGYQSNALDTAFALLALKASGSTNSFAISRAITALTGLQGADGSFGINEQPSAYITSLATLAMAGYSQSYAIGSAISAAKGYLVSLQVSGAYATTLDNSLAALAFAATSTDNSSYGASQQFLRTAQLADGSWADDPYLTSLALRALAAAASGSAPSPNGQVSGRVVEDGGGPIIGAEIDLIGSQVLQGTSGADGTFLITAVPPGSYTVKVSKPGYSTLSIATIVSAGVNSNQGDLRLVLGSSSTGLQGTVRNGITGQPIAGASVAIAGGGSATTDASGNYRITGVVAGPYSATVSLAGFDTVTTAGTFASGTIILFSPALYPAGQTPNAATITGSVVSTLGPALPGATINVNGATATTDATGGFTLSGLVAGSTSVVVSASGFVTRTYSVTLAAGSNNVGALAIAPSGSTITVSGRVTDRASALPVAAATVLVQGASLAATTGVNGTYSISGIATTQFTLQVSAAGYVIKTFGVTLGQLVDSTVDIVLDKASTGGLTVQSISTNRSAYDPFNAIEIETEVANSTASTPTLAFSASVFDAAGNLHMQTVQVPKVMQANGVTEIELETHNTNDPAGAYTVVVQGTDAGGVVQVQASTSFVINATTTMTGGIALNPPITQIGAGPVTVNASLFNHGNIPMPGGDVLLTVTVDSVDANYNPIAQASGGVLVASGAPFNHFGSAAFDSSGVLWILNIGNNSILRMAPDNSVTTFLDLTTVPGSFTNVVDMARDPAGNLYVAETNDVVLKIAPDKTATRLQTGIGNQKSVAVDASGNIWVAALGPTPIYSVNPVTGAATPYLGQGFVQPHDIVAAADGTLYVTNNGDNSIAKVSPAGAVTTFVTGLASPQGIEIDGAGNLYVANSLTNSVLVIAPSGAIAAQPYVSGIASPTALRFDPQGNLFVSSLGSSTTPPAIYKVPAGGGAPQVFAKSLVPTPQGLAYDSQGALYAVGQRGDLARVAASGAFSNYTPAPSGAFGVAIGPGDKPFVSVGGSGDIIRYDSPTSQFTYTGFSGSQGIVWDGGSLLYVAERAGNRISSLDVNSGTHQTIADTIVNTADDIYFAPSGDRYILNNTRIDHISGGSSTLFASSGFSATSFVGSGAGGFYLQGGNNIYIMSSAGIVTRNISMPTGLAAGIALDSTGAILVGEGGTRLIRRVNPSTGTIDAAPFADLNVSIPSNESIAAINGDGSGGLVALSNGGKVVRVPSTGGNASLLGALQQVTDSLLRIAYDPAGNFAYVKGGSSIYAFNVAAGTSTKIVNRGSNVSFGGIQFANGLVVAGYGTGSEIVSYTTAGVEVDTIAGLNSPSYVTWDGTRIIAVDSSKTISIVPGQLPKTLARDTAQFVTYSNGKLYGTKNQNVITLDPSTFTYQTYFNTQVASSDNFAVPLGLAARASDGALSFATPSDGRVETISASRQVLSTYAGVGQVITLATDASGNVFAASSDYRQISRIPASGPPSTVFATGTVVNGLKVVNGTLYGSSGSVVIPFNADGTAQPGIQAVDSSAGFAGITSLGNTIYAIDFSEQSIRVLQQPENRFVTIASGVTNPTSIRAGPDGALYIGNIWGSVVRAAGGVISKAGADLGTIQSLSFLNDGHLLVGNTSAEIYAFDPGTLRQTTLLSAQKELTSSPLGLWFVAADSAGGFALGARAANDGVYRFNYTPPPALPAIGSVVGTPQRITLPAVSVGSDAANAAFANFAPPFGGDFRFTITRADGTSGQAVNTLHVGPSATGTMTVSKASVPAGTASVHVATRVVGADNTSISRIDAARMTKSSVGGFLSQFHAIGGDAAGDLLFSTLSLNRISPQGLQDVAFAPPSGSLGLGGDIPVDSKGYVYVDGDPGTQTIYRVKLNPGAPATIVKAVTIPELIVGLARDSTDAIWALTLDSTGHANIYVVHMDDPVTPYQKLALSTQFTNPWAITIDGRDNIYVETRDPAILKINRNGTVSNLIAPDPFGDPTFENEGGHIAGDCANNLFTIPLRWRAFGQGATTALADIEEHVILQLVGNTGRVAQVIDGWQISPDLQDFDGIGYDRFSNSLILYNELHFTTGDQQLYRIPVTCGAISADLHVVLALGQAGTGFSPPPAATIANADGTQELVWHLSDADVSGLTVAFDTTLQALTYGEKRPVAQSAYVALQNSFASGTIQVPVSIPSVSVDAQIDIGVSVDKSSYMANDDVSGTVMLTNRDVASRTVQLVVSVADAQGNGVDTVISGPITLAAGQVVTIPAPYNVGTLLVGTYRMRAQISDATSGVALAADTAPFDIVTSGTTLIASLSADKIAYDPLDQVTLTARVKNVSPNAISSGVSVTLVVTNAANVQVLNQTRAVPSLTPGAFQDAIFQYRLQASDIGQFTAALTVNDPSVGPRTTSFAVRSSADTGTGLRGAVVATSPVNAGDQVLVRASMSNSGNAAVTSMPVTIVVINPANGQSVATFTGQATLAQGGTAEVDYTWDTTGLSAGTYIIGASAAFAGRTIALGQANVLVTAIQPFTFVAVTGAPLNTSVQSNAVTITGIAGSTGISVVGGEIQIGSSGTWVTSGSVTSGQQVVVRLTTANAFNTTATATVTVAGFSAPFSVTTTGASTTPNPFTFTSLTNVPLSSVQTSNTVTITGIQVPVPISIVGGTYSINGGSFTSAAGTVNPGDTVTVQVTASGTAGATTTATLTIGGVTGTFSATTNSAVTNPNSFSFTSQTNVAPNTVTTSNTVTITGINVAVPISIVGGTYSINGGAYTSAAGTIANGNTVSVRLTSSATAGATVTATLAVSGVTGTFSVTTQASQTTVNPFSFTAQTNVPLSTGIVSNNATITGINTSVPIAVAGGQYNVNNGTFTANSGTVNNNDVVSMKVTSSGSYATPVTGQLTVSQFSTGFTVTTIARPDPVVASVFSNAARVLVLVSCKNAQGAEDYACESQRRTSLDSYLTSLGIEHRVVTDTETFRSELHCGRWNTYWVSGGAAKLKDTLLEEVREAVARGDALIVDGVRDASSTSLDPIVGQTYVGTATESATALLTGTIEPVGSFTDAGGAYKVSISTGAAQAHFGTATGDPAIVTHSYGNGRAISFAFDFAGTLIAQPTSTLLQAVTGQSLGWLVVAPAGHFTGDQYVAVITTLSNPAVIPQEVQVVATLPSGATFNASTPAAQSTTASTVTWHMTLAAGLSVPIAWSLRTPQATGTDSISFAATRIDSTGSNAIGTTTLGFDVTVLSDEGTQTTAALNALGVTATAEVNARNSAANDVLAGQTKAGQGLYGDAIGQYLAAVDSLLTITSVSTATARTGIDKLLQEASRDWCRGGTACVPGTITGSAYSLIVLGSASLSNGSSTGSVGAGGAATLSSYTVASSLSGNAARFVGGSTLSWNNGAVGNGGSGVIDVASTNTVSSSVGRAELVTTAVENWSSIQIDQRARADRYAAMSGTAATTGSGGAVNCTGTDPSWNVCTITTAQLAGAQTINLSYPTTANVLVNITGTTLTLTNGQTKFNGAMLQGSSHSHQVIFNAAQMTSLTINGWGWGGTLLAPRAAVTHQNSLLDGQAVFSTLSSTSGNYSCAGTFDGVTP